MALAVHALASDAHVVDRWIAVAVVEIKRCAVVVKCINTPAVAIVVAKQPLTFANTARAVAVDAASA